MASNAPARIGIDLGGTKIEAVVLGKSGEVRWRRRVPTPPGDYAHLLDPDVVVLGGGVSRIERLYANVPARWHEHVFAGGVRNEPVRTRLLPARHGDASGVRGAAWLWG